MKKALYIHPGPDSICCCGQIRSLSPDPQSSNSHCEAPCHSLDDRHSLCKASGRAPLRNCFCKQQGGSSREQQTAASHQQTPGTRLPPAGGQGRRRCQSTWPAQSRGLEQQRQACALPSDDLTPTHTAWAPSSLGPGFKTV